jgi:exonuclease SbcC
MKILQLRFKNLNSLAGEWSIDFTTPEYVSDGIFAISGPTGAGKSTILDAICLALYGRTPRLKTISKSTNEIMSRQTGICFSEVIFETNEGSYRAYWSQGRAREKSEGMLQNPRHELSDAGTKQILTSQLTTTANEIEKKTGMDYGRFVQSMMLAQGGFAAFLQASGNERAPILEQITGTEIYSKISIHVFDKQRAERAALDQLRAEIQGILILSDEDEAEVTKDVVDKDTHKNALVLKLEQLDRSIQWLNTLKTLNEELGKISLEEIELAQVVSEFEPRREILKKALKTLPLEGEYSSLIAIRNQQIKAIGTLNDLRASVPGLENAVTAGQVVFDAADKQYNAARIEREEILKLTLMVRKLDQEIFQKETAVQNIEKRIRLLNLEKESEIKTISGLNDTINSFNLEAETINKYLTGNQADSALITEFTGLKTTMDGLIEAHDSLLKAENDLREATELLKSEKLKVTELTTQVTLSTKARDVDRENITQIQNEIDRLLNGRTVEEISQRKDDLLLFIAELKKVADLDEDRKQLKDGKACPLCGSKHHPYAEGIIPQTNEFELEMAGLIQDLGKQTNLTKHLNSLQEIEKKSTAKTVEINHKLELAQQQVKSLEENIEKQNNEATRVKLNFDLSKNKLAGNLILYGIAEIPDNKADIQMLIKRLESRKNEWQKKEIRKKEIDELITGKQANIKVAEAIIETKNGEIGPIEKEADDLKISLKSIRIKRSELFGEKKVDEEETKTLNQQNDAESKKNMASATLQDRKQQLEINITRISDLEKETLTRQQELEKGEKIFLQHIRETGFENEGTFISYRLPADEKAMLEQEDNQIKTKLTQLDTRKKEKEQALAREKAKKLTEEEQDILSESHEESKNALDALLQEIGALKEKLDSNQKAKDRGAAILQKIERQTAVYTRWANLSNLIGSADGKKYRNFAQGLTLEIMVSHANDQLEKLSDRYLLTRDKVEPLEINVIDNYQAGEIRSTKNLSGGESFIVSLALALGLSRMSSRKVKVDSLFLDEGFGTLDEETLETALATLAGLRQDGKMIGVISHVGALKERINTKITVQPIREGRSFLSGPGCTEIKNIKSKIS